MTTHLYLLICLIGTKLQNLIQVIINANSQSCRSPSFLAGEQTTKPAYQYTGRLCNHRALHSQGKTMSIPNFYLQAGSAVQNCVSPMPTGDTRVWVKAGIVLFFLASSYRMRSAFCQHRRLLTECHSKFAIWFSLWYICTIQVPG